MCSRRKSLNGTESRFSELQSIGVAVAQRVGQRTSVQYGARNGSPGVSDGSLSSLMS